MPDRAKDAQVGSGQLGAQHLGRRQDSVVAAQHVGEHRRRVTVAPGLAGPGAELRTVHESASGRVPDRLGQLGPHPRLLTRPSTAGQTTPLPATPEQLTHRHLTDPHLADRTSERNALRY